MAAEGQLQQAGLAAARASVVRADGGGAALETAGGALEPGGAETVQRSDPHANLPHQTSVIANLSNY